MHTAFQEFHTGKEAYLPDRALMGHMRALALDARPDGFAAIQPPSGAKEAIRALRGVLARTHDEDRGAALQRAAESVGFFEAAAFSPAPRGCKSLPAVNGEARVQRIAREILLHSDGQPSIQRLEDSLRTFCEARSLRMEELACMPEALRMESLRLFSQVALSVVRMQKEREAAARWADGQGPLRSGCTFLEHAILLCRESDAPGRREELEKALAAEEGGAQSVIQRAHERQARLCMWLENLPGAMRMPSTLDTEALLRISDAASLLTDSACYAACDEESRAMLRARIGEIAHAGKISETAVVRGALDLARGGAPGTLRAEPTWYWADDHGRQLLLGHLGCADVRMKKLVPDPKGNIYITAIGLIALGLFVLLRAASLPSWLCAAIGCWTVAAQAINAACVRLFPPRPLLRLALDGDIPDDMRTLVVIPAILPNPDRARELVSQLETLAAGDRDKNIEFCLLGDFPDSSEQTLPGDEDTLLAARDAVDEVNRRTGSRRLYFLHRSRQWSAPSGKWMGHERKRGALHALNALLLGGESAFDADGRDSRMLANRFRYVITLDADTRPYPDSLRMLIGTIAHPLNRLSGKNVLQPHMVQSASSRISPFVRFMAGAAGVSGYGGGVSEVYQDLCGQGGFAGKGIYEIEPFDRLAGSTLPDNAILSHDLIEGFLAGSAFASDIVFLDHFPGSLAAYFKRMHRWTRGDWQLLPFLSGRSALQKYRMLDNLRASLAPISALCLILSGLAFHSLSAIALGLLICLSGALFSLAGADGWLRALAQLSILPNEAYCRLDAAARALYRTFFSHRGMLEWVSAADAERQAGKTPAWPRIAAALLCVAASLMGGAALWGAVFAVLFLMGAPVLESMEAMPDKPRLSDEQRAFIEQLARDTWRYFSEHTCESGFPPDNVQFDPPRGAADRTSPTNIGLYMASCAAAEKLGFISRAEMLERLETTAESIERAEKWRGQMFNWYDPVSCQPLRPRYISSVDSGNLAACLMLCAQAVREVDESHPLAARLEQLARDMDLGALYDPVRRLFHIGYDAERGALSQSHYDLLASESRILSYTAIWLGKAPVSHWKRLSRACVAAGDGAAPVSWSGTMFEYLMPELFLATPEHSLLGEGCRMCIEEQKRSRISGFWGISESGYYAFDARRNFQYRAFGVREMMLKDERTGKVISPYSSALALEIDPHAAAENLKSLYKAGYTIPCGLAEAIDFAPERLGSRSYGVISSAMAHHQGMLLLACANALTGGSLRALYAEQPGARALLPLLEEMQIPRSCLPRRERPRQSEAQKIAKPRAVSQSREAKPGLVPPDAHLLCGGGSALYLSGDGEACMHAEGVRVNRWLSDPSLSGDGFFTHLREEHSGDLHSLLEGPARFAPGSAQFRRRTKALDIQTNFCLSPEDGALLRRVAISNRTDRPLRVEIRDIALLSLCRDAEADEHPSFHNLFLECSFPEMIGTASALPEKPQGRVLRITRRPREQSAGVLALDYSVCGLEKEDALELCADRPGMLLRGADPASAQNVFASPFRPNLPGAGITPIQGARIRLTIPAHGERIIGFSSLISRAADPFQLPEADRYLQMEALLRAQRLAEVQSRSLLRFLDLPEQADRLYGRAASLCVYAKPMCKAASPAQPGLGRESLWPMGISGERPLLTAIVQKSIKPASDILRLHAYLSAMGLATDAILLYDEEPGYSQPMRDQLIERIEENRLQSGNVHLFARGKLEERTLRAVEQLSAVLLQGEDTLETAFADGSRWIAPAKQPAPELTAPDDAIKAQNYGEFSEDGALYKLKLAAGESTPQAWSNILAGRSMGALATERGGGFLWYRNSRNARLTPFRNDCFAEGAAIKIWLEDADRHRHDLMPRPVSIPAEVCVRQGESEYILRQGGIAARIVRYTDPDQPVHAVLIFLESEDARRHSLRLHAACEWLMGVHAGDLRAVRTAFSGDCQLAFGSLSCTGCMRLAGAHPEGDHQALDIVLEPEKPLEAALLITAGDSADEAERLALEYDAKAGHSETQKLWQDLLSRIAIHTGDSKTEAILSRWMPYQAIASRFWGRAGLYQSGGAYGFRDQLQDALCLCAIAPGWTREHILLCAAHQFPEGDVQHWWHPERTGVRTRISDDLLFLPYVTAKYVQETGDGAILSEPVPYLSGDTVPEDRHDLYFEAGVADLTEPLREHCMRAIRRVASMTGAHGLPLMGSGDWNDGMDRVGANGKGESVWLAEFLSVTAREFAEISVQNSDELAALSQQMLENIERHAWDGDRYLRAFRDDGSPLGSESTEGGCRIDAISQSWAVLAGCDANRARTAMNTLWARLFDDDLQILRLLDPPFDGNIANTGYIAAYPPGIRENGGQYTHAACWAMLAYARLGDRQRAWKLLHALLPANHADTREKADRYRTEPYALAADIYACGASYQGRGGWTWYTGAAGWLFRSALTGVAGFERRGNRVRMCALLDEGMDEMRVVIRHGASEYTLVSGRAFEGGDWAELVDDGREHTLTFGAR